MTSIRFLTATVALLVTAGAAALAAPAITNGGFENGTVPIKGAAGYCREGNLLPGWSADPNAGRNTTGFAFFDNGRVPEGESVCFLQNDSAVSQMIRGFAAGTTYRLRLRANGRAADRLGIGRNGSLRVTLNGTTLLAEPNIKPVDTAGSYGAAFHELVCDFTTGQGDYLLELRQVGGTDGVSVLVDDVRLEVAPAGTKAAVRVNQAVVLGMGEALAEPDLGKAWWVWGPGSPQPQVSAPVGRRHFRKIITVPTGATVASAVLALTADNRCDVLSNGEWVGAAEGFTEIYRLDLTNTLQAGANVIGLVARNEGAAPNPAGVAGALAVRLVGEDEARVTPVDRTWRCAAEAPEGWLGSEFDDTGWSPAVEVIPMGSPPWGRVGYLATTAAPDFPSFHAPGAEAELALLRRMFALHYPQSGPVSTLWDGWSAMSSLWPATTSAPGNEALRAAWRAALLSRRIDAEGYVSTHQHVGTAHSEGWPFPLWSQAGGIGWHFSLAGMPFVGSAGLERPATPQGWRLSGLEGREVSPEEGWRLAVTEDRAILTSPKFDVDSYVSPFILVEWRGGPFAPGARASLEWTTDRQPRFRRENAIPLPLPDASGMTCANLPLYRSPAWAGRLTRLRLRLDGMAGAEVVIKRVHTAVDSRHPINNSNYLQGCCDYVDWTGDVGFLRENIARMRAALTFAVREFRTEEEGCVLVPWVGHDGRAGFTVRADGGKDMHYGGGIGNNYWDLLPTGGRDTLATLYYYDAARRMAGLEGLVDRHPEWGVGTAGRVMAPRALAEHAERLRERASRMLWNPETGRFAACRDADGKLHDYGYTFVNLEAIHYGLATPGQARQIMDWIGGQRLVPADTAQGPDIYHWRFAPRASTLRNEEWYVFAWTGPESIPWGYQVQDGGAVLGFSYHDLMARLLTNGPDDAWARLREITRWFGEVLAEGGYRKYYRDPSRGTLQGGGPPGGLGMDCEFVESVLVPQVMLYGFLGFRPGVEGFGLDPQLPSDWPELRLDRIAFQGSTLDITASRDALRIRVSGQSDRPLSISPPPGKWQVSALDEDGKLAGLARTVDVPPGGAVPLPRGDVREVILQRVK